MRRSPAAVPAIALLALSALAGEGCSRRAGDSLPPPPLAAPGEPLPGLRPAELARFEAGKALFVRRFTPAEGLGPFFNEDACNACHTDPADGGTGEQTAVKATRFTPPDRCDELEAEGGVNVRKQATPLLRARGITREAIPARATERAAFTVPFLYGLGLVEAIPDSAIVAHADPSDKDGDGISGRVSRLPDGSIGRFSRKAEEPTLRAFIDTALRFEMGLTTPLHPAEERLGGRPFPTGTDPAPDPEISEAQLDLLVDYVRFLAPPANGRPTPAGAALDTVRTGERLFRELGCAACHIPEMQTGPSSVPALDRKTVPLYSDLLLHDMGPALADVCGVAATPSELRTAPLMGLGYRRRYLHDGRTNRLVDAILLHGGEARRARDAFARLGPVGWQPLLRFLKGL